MINKSKKHREKTEQIGVRLERPLFEKLERIAEDEHRTIANVAWIAISEYVERRSAEASAA